MRRTGKIIIGIVLIGIPVLCGFITFFGILWLISPYLSISAGAVITYLWIENKDMYKF